MENLNRDNLVQIDGVWCTNEIRTICELILHDRDYQPIVESLSHYVNTEKNLEKLIELAREYEIEEELERYIVESEEYYEE